MEEQIKLKDKTDPVSGKDTASLPFTSYQKFVMILLAFLQFTIVLDFMILSPLGDILMKSMNMSTGQFGSVVSAYAISAGVSGFLAAGFADKYDRKKLLVFFYVGFILGTVFCGLAYNYETLFMARIITGIFGGVIGSISMAIITDIFPIQQRGRVMAVVQMAFAGSQILGIPIGLYLATKYNWNATFFMVVVLASVVGIAVVFKLKPLTEHLKFQNENNAIRHLISTIKRKDYRIGFIATAMLSMGGFMLMPFTSAFLVNNVHVPQDKLHIVFLFTGLSSFIIMPMIGKLSDKMDKLRIFTIGSAVAIVMIIVYTNLPPVPIWQVVIVNVILFMGIMGRMVPATILNSAMPDAADRGAYMSVNSSLQQMAGGVAAMFAGLVVVQHNESGPIEHFDTLGYVMSGLIIWCIYLMYRVNNLVKAKSKTNSEITLD